MVSVPRVEERSSGHGVTGGLWHPGFRESVALRGAMLERGPWSNHEDGGTIQPSVQRLDDETRGARVARTRRGTFTLVVLRQQAAGGEVLRSGLFGPCNPALSFNGHRRKRWSDRGVARKRRHGRTVAFRVALFCELAAQEGRFWRGCHGSQPSRSFFDRGRPWRRKKRDGSEGGFRVTAEAGRLDFREKRVLESVSVRRK